MRTYLSCLKLLNQMQIKHLIEKGLFRISGGGGKHQYFLLCEWVVIYDWGEACKFAWSTLVWGISPGFRYRDHFPKKNIGGFFFFLPILLRHQSDLERFRIILIIHKHCDQWKLELLGSDFAKIIWDVEQKMVVLGEIKTGLCSSLIDAFVELEFVESSLK